VLNDLVQQAQRELAPAMEGRTIAWVIHPLPEVKGDPNLLLLVWTNLLSNAIKYTAPRAEARIEVGALAGDNGEAQLFVRDNGVGFDARYTHKLFGVFQRLHSDAEFAGTGIGLATVRRIIDRHGGRVWAETEPERGATFWFSLKRAD
jgi:signal transduction histidine kinase